MGFTSGVRFPAEVRDFPFSKTSRPTQGTKQPPVQWLLESSSPPVKLPWREYDHLPPSTVEIRNATAIPVLPHEMQWNNFKSTISVPLNYIHIALKYIIFH